MRIAWFTPYWTHSAVGTFSRHVAERLAGAVDLELWIPERAGSQPTGLPVIEFDPDALDSARLAQADLIVYNVGNSLAFHGSIMRVARQVPGLVVLHDLVMHHFYASEALARPDGKEYYYSLLERWYGPDAAGEGASLAGGRSGALVVPPLSFCVRYPLLEEVASNGSAIVVHSRDQERRLAPMEFAPLVRLQLPSYRAESTIGAAPERAPSKDERLRLATVGWLDESKQIHRVIDAIATQPGLRDRVRYRIIGETDGAHSYLMRLQDAVERHGLGGVVEFAGYVSDVELRKVLDWADVFVNLRWPSTEGGSASLLEQLITGRPTVVVRGGVFDELPEDAVVKIAPARLDSVGEELMGLSERPDRRRLIGRRGREVAAARTIEQYARDLLEFMEVVSP